MNNPRALSRTLALALTALLLAGCAAPAATPRDAPDAHALFTSSLDVDLRESVLNITMPEGQPTMLVALNVTKDMWVRPVPGVVGVGSAPTEDPRYWTLCPRLRSEGIERPFGYRGMVFWLDGHTLVPAVAFIQRFHFAAEDSGGWFCATDVTSERSEDGIRTDEPFDGTLVVLVHVFEVLEERMEDEGASALTSIRVPPGYTMSVGIGTKCANDASRFCVPENAWPVDPTLYGGPGLHAICTTHVSGADACTAAGFQVDDTRVGEGPTTSGTLTLSLRTPDAPGIAFLQGNLLSATYVGFAGGAPGTFGTAQLEVSVQTEAERVATTCDTRLLAAGRALLQHARSATAAVKSDVDGDYETVMVLWDLPINLPSLGWTLEPTARTYDDLALMSVNNVPGERCA